MEVGINLYTKWPFRDVIDAFVENGIEHTFVCAEQPRFEEAMAALKRANITVDNLHAPFKNLNRIWSEEDATGEEMLRLLMQGVDQCADHGVGLMVAHVSNGKPMPPIIEAGLARYDRLMDYAREKGVSIAFESHRFLENVRFFMERYPQAGFCLDNGHEDAFTPGVRYVKLWGDRLVATHISDNECVCDVDMHMLPFDGHIDFDLAARELAECGYEGTLMLEIKPGNHVRYADVAIRDYYKTAAQRIRQFAAMVERYRNIRNGI